MSACSFSVPVSADVSIDKMLSKAKKFVESQGGQFEGDESSGSFNASVFGNSIAGSYTYAEGQDLQIVIDDKPFMVPCAMIESMLKQQLS